MRTETVNCAGAWALALVASLLGGVTMLYCTLVALDSWHDPDTQLEAVVLAAIALAVPIAPALSLRRGVRRGELREALLLRVSVATLSVVGFVYVLLSVLWWIVVAVVLLSVVRLS
jgi:hypothetical protein